MVVYRHFLLGIDGFFWDDVSYVVWIFCGGGCGGEGEESAGGVIGYSVTMVANLMIEIQNQSQLLLVL